MKVAYLDDGQKGPGYGILEFSEAMFPDSPWQIAIQRGTDHNFLSGKKTDQWVGETIYFPVAGDVNEEGSLEIFLDPEVVDSLNIQDQYQVFLKGGDSGPLRARLKIGLITYTPDENRENTARAEQREDPAPAPRPSPKPAQASVEVPKEPEPPKENTAPLSMQPASPQQPEKSRWHGVWKYAILAVLALLCLAWFLIDPGKRGEDAEQAKTEEPAASAASSQRENGQPKEEIVGASTGRPQQAGVEQQVRDFFAAANVTPQGAFNLSGQLPKQTAADQDAVYRLYYYAAEKDFPQALMPYAACLDPSQPQWGTIEKDAPLAWSVYERAKNSQPEAAAAAQKNMLNWLLEQVKAGNAKAREWLGALPK